MQEQSSATPAQSPEEHRELRPCRSCRATGWVMLDAEYDPTSGELTEERAPCFICKGAGKIRAIVYGSDR
jgi:hypothetical protein